MTVVAKLTEILENFVKYSVRTEGIYQDVYGAVANPRETIERRKDEIGGESTERDRTG